MTESDRKDMHRFVNRLRILRSIDSWELPYGWDTPVQRNFMKDPYTFVVRAEPTKLADLYRVIRDREGDRLLRAAMTNWVAASPGEMEFKKTPTEYGEIVRSRFTVSAARKRTERDSQNWGFWEGCTDGDRQKAKRTYHRRLRSWRIVQTSARVICTQWFRRPDSTMTNLG